MSKLCYFDVSGWLEDGSPLPAENRQEVIDILGRSLSADELDSLEDSIASYAEAYEDYCIEELIHDVLNAAAIEHWIISPMRTYRI